MTKFVHALARALFALGAFAALAACSQKSAPDASYAPEAVASNAVQSFDGASPAPPPQPAQDSAQGGILLAYSYSVGVLAPKKMIPPMVAAHEKHCVDAGPSMCQVLGSSVNSWDDDRVSAFLNIRAEPQWLETFREELATDADGAGGKIASNTVSTEDLTQYITDTNARLEAKITLRERIRKLLETREGSLNDVLAAERALADVQGEIDSMTAQLEAAKARVAMSALSVSYESDPKTSAGFFKPLADAFGAFGRTSIASLGEAVDFVARIWPFFILALVVLWIVRVWWRGRRRKA